VRTFFPWQQFLGLRQAAKSTELEILNFPCLDIPLQNKAAQSAEPKNNHFFGTERRLKMCCMFLTAGTALGSMGGMGRIGL
jgi:hypothetical protein